MLLNKQPARGALTPGWALVKHSGRISAGRQWGESLGSGWTLVCVCFRKDGETLSVLQLLAIFAGSQGQEYEHEYSSAPKTPTTLCIAIKAALQEAQLSTAHQAVRAAELWGGIWCAVTGLPGRAPWSEQKYLIRPVSCNCHVEKTRQQIGFVWSMGKKDHFIHLSSADVQHQALVTAKCPHSGRTDSLLSGDMGYSGTLHWSFLNFSHSLAFLCVNRKSAVEYRKSTIFLTAKSKEEFALISEGKYRTWLVRLHSNIWVHKDTVWNLFTYVSELGTCA